MSTGITKLLLLERLPAINTDNIAFNGARLYGIFGTPTSRRRFCHRHAALSVALVCGAEKGGSVFFCRYAVGQRVRIPVGVQHGRDRLLHRGGCSISDFCGKGSLRGAARMLEVAVPALCAFAAFALFNSERTTIMMPVLLADAAAAVALELLLAGRVSGWLEEHPEGRRSVW